jgi:hypothetical protein
MPVHLTVEYAGHLIAESFDAPDGEYYFVTYGILRNSTSGTPESP